MVLEPWAVKFKKQYRNHESDNPLSYAEDYVNNIPKLGREVNNYFESIAVGNYTVGAKIYRLA